MTLKEAQEKVDQWIKKYGVRYFDELTPTLKIRRKQINDNWAKEINAMYN